MISEFHIFLQLNSKNIRKFWMWVWKLRWKDKRAIKNRGAHMVRLVDEWWIIREERRAVPILKMIQCVEQVLGIIHHHLIWLLDVDTHQNWPLVWWVDPHPHPPQRVKAGPHHWLELQAPGSAFSLCGYFWPPIPVFKGIFGGWMKRLTYSLTPPSKLIHPMLCVQWTSPCGFNPKKRIFVCHNHMFCEFCS